MSYQPIRTSVPEDSRIYRRELLELALTYSPEIFPCPTCKHPVATGFVCGTCGDDDTERLIRSGYESGNVIAE